MEVTMNIAGARKPAAVVNKQRAEMADRAIKENVVLNQKLARALDMKNKAMSDKAISDEMLTRVKSDLATANRTIFDLKAQVAELTASLNNALTAKKTTKKVKSAEVESPIEEA